MRKLFLALFLVTQLKDPKPGFNLFSPQQDIQVGQEAKAKVAAEQPVVQNEQLTGYLTDLLKRLPRTYSADSRRFPAIRQLVSTIEIPAGPRPVSRNQ